MWAKGRPVPSFLFSNLSEPSCAAGKPRQKARRWRCSSGNQSGCSTGLFILCATRRRSTTCFFPQTAALSPLRPGRNVEPAQLPSRQRSGAGPRPVPSGPAGVLFQSRAARWLRKIVLAGAGRGFAASHVHRLAGLVVAPGVAVRAFPQGRRRKAAAAFRAGVGVSAAAQIAPATRRLAGAALPRATSSTKRSV